METPVISVILYRWVQNKERRIFVIKYLILHSEIKFIIKILVMLELNNNETKIDY